MPRPALPSHPNGIPQQGYEKFPPIHAKSEDLNVLPEAFYTTFFSEAAKTRKSDPIRDLFHLEHAPGVISLLAGKPNSSTFPITSMHFTARDPTNPTSEIPIELSSEELQVALQYSLTSGLTSLCDWLYSLQEFSHGRKKSDDWKLSVGAGSQDLINKAVTALVNPRDPVLIESPVYAGIIPLFQSLQCDITEVETDSQGICSHSLSAVLENWPDDKPKPKVLYTVPYGCNPTGATATLERRLEILALSRKHNFLILEDDPYFYLYFGPAPRPPSYFALERSQREVGRVVRFDSLSKILSSGIRVGFISGPRPIVAAIDKHSATANLQPSSLSQVLALAVLSRWGHQGFLTHTERVAQFYRAKRDVFEVALKKHLDGLVKWDSPEAGMFIWFRIDLGSGSAIIQRQEEQEEVDSEDLIRTKAFEKGVLALPGTIFWPCGRKSAYVRAAFSVLDEEDVEEALRRLKEAIVDARGCGDSRK